MTHLKLIIPLALASAVASADPHVAKVGDVTTGTCNTDGGNVTCSPGVRYLGSLVQSWWNFSLTDKPLACAADVKPGSFTFTFGYGYNEGKIFVQDNAKVQEKWPACVSDFVKQSSDKLLEWWKVLQPIDGSIDVNSKYKVTITIKN